ncbi:MAG: hypothetical protein R2812_09180 [Gelidibacter sp.]
MGTIIETHTLIIWSNALNFKETILNQLKTSFSIKRIFEVQWNKNSFLDNLKIFYSHSQSHLSYNDYNDLILKKIEHCGDDPFYLIVYEDEQPKYENRITSSGKRSVNTNVFDLKQSLRSLTGGGHKIHASDTIFESNKDLTLVLGLNINDFKAKYLGYTKEVQIIQNNCIGADGYKDIVQLFYVLNNSANYCVLRNFECLPDAYTIEGHGDIDLLVDNLNYIVYLTNADPVYPHLEYRVYYLIQINNEKVPFDFRFLGDNYYDIKWQLSILESKVFYKNLFFVPNNVNYFYSLLYHAFVQKPSVKADYHKKLKQIGTLIDFNYSQSLTLDNIKLKLDNFLNTYGYNYTIPNDYTVFYNKLFLENDTSRTSQYGENIAKSQSRYEHDFFFSEIYLKNNIISKVASNPIISNETFFLTLLSEYDYFPKLLNNKNFKGFGLAQMEFFEGVSFVQIYSEKQFWNLTHINRFIYEGIEILKILIRNEVVHRDIRPDNLILIKDKESYFLKLFDFGWATTVSKRHNCITPRNLGSQFKFSEGQFSDAYSFGKLVNLYFGKIAHCKKISEKLCLIKPEDYNNVDLIEKKLNIIQEEFISDNILLSLRDRLVLFLYKNPRVKKIAVKILKKVNLLKLK